MCDSMPADRPSAAQLRSSITRIGATHLAEDSRLEASPTLLVVPTMELPAKPPIQSHPGRSYTVHRILINEREMYHETLRGKGSGVPRSQSSISETPDLCSFPRGVHSCSVDW